MVNIHGKEYMQVNERLAVFRKNFPNWSLESEIVNCDGEECIIKATIKNENGEVIATGHAQESKNASTINKTSYVENCETSAWGRALGNLGIGIDTAICTAEELLNAVKEQAEVPEPNSLNKFLSKCPPSNGTIAEIMKLAKEKKMSIESICKHYKVKELNKLTSTQADEVLKTLEQ